MNNLTHSWRYLLEEGSLGIILLFLVGAFK